MEVIKKMIELENEKFVLVKGTGGSGTYYGTIPYTELNEQGVMKREMNGHEMCVSFENPDEAIQNRVNRIKLDRYKAEGHTKSEVLMFIASGFSAENWDAETFERVKEIV